MSRDDRPSPAASRRRARWVRGGVAIALGLGPVVLMLASVVVEPWRYSGDPARAFGLALCGLAVGFFNLYLSHGRPWVYRRRRGSLAGYQFVSGVPAVGTMLVIAAGVVGFGSVVIAALGLLTLAVDTGGLPWFLMGAWRDASFWDD